MSGTTGSRSSTSIRRRAREAVGLSSDADDAACAAWPGVDVARLRGHEDEQPHCRFPISRTIGFIGRMDLASGKLTKLQEIKGMMLYKVTSVAFDEQARTAYYTEDNYAFRDLMAVNVDTGRRKMLIRDARIGDFVVNPRTSRSGASATRTGSRPSSGSRRPMPASIRSTPSNMARSRSTSTSRLTASCFPRRSERSTERKPSACGSSTSSRPTSSPSRSPSSPCHPRPRRASSSLPTERRFTGRPIRACRTSSGSTSRRKSSTP